MNLAWISYANDVINLDTAKFDAALKAVHDSGGNTMRVWLSTNGANDPLFDANGYVSGPHAKTIGNIQKMLQLAKKNDMLLMLTLMSHNWMSTSQGNNVTYNEKMLETDSGISAYVNNYIIPVTSAIGDDPNILCWEVFNEPEGMVQNWSGLKSGVTMVDIQKMVNRVAGAIHRTVPGVLVSNGAVVMSYTSDVSGTNYYTDSALKAVGGDTSGTLDFYIVHFYRSNGASVSPFSKTYAYWKLDKPLVVAEYPAELSASDKGYFGSYTSVDSLLLYLDDNGYAGGLGWMYMGDANITSTAGFATFAHSIALEYASDSSSVKLTGASDSKFSVAVTVGNGGSVTRSPTGRIDSGATDTLVAVPASGYVFKGWSGDTSATGDTLIIKVTKDVSLTASFTPDASTNLLTNGDFSSGSTGWGSLSINTPTANAATVDYSSGAAVVSVTKADTLNWHIQLSQSGVALDSGATYVLSFDASASVARQLAVGFSSGSPNWTWLGGGGVNVSTEMSSFSLEVVPTASATAGVIQFQVGSATGTLTLDNVTLTKKASSASAITSRTIISSAFAVTRTGSVATWSVAQPLTRATALRVLDAQGRCLARRTVAPGVTSGLVPETSGSGLRWVVLDGRGSAMLPSLR